VDQNVAVVGRISFSRFHAAPFTLRRPSNRFVVLLVCFAWFLMAAGLSWAGTIFDNVTAGWVSDVSLPSGRYGMGYAMHSNNLYLVAGDGPNGPSNSVFRYDGGTSWVTCANLPVSDRRNPAVFSLGGKLYCAAGESNGWAQSTAHRFDGASWTAVSSLPSPRRDFGYAVLGNYAYIMGGMDGSANHMNTVYRFDGTSWTVGTALPLARNTFIAATIGGMLYVMGGTLDAGVQTTSILKFDGTTWTAAGNMPRWQYTPAVCVESNKTIVLIGGRDTSYNAITNIIAFDGTNWTERRGLSSAIERGHAAGILSNTLYVAGGREFFAPSASTRYYRQGSTGLTPTSGDQAGGFTVTIMGAGLGNGSDITNVTLCGVPASSVDSQSATQVVITASAASGPTSGAVRVFSTSQGETVKSNVFTYTYNGPIFAVYTDSTNWTYYIASGAAPTSTYKTHFGAVQMGRTYTNELVAAEDSGSFPISISTAEVVGAGAAAFSIGDMPLGLDSYGYSNFLVRFTPPSMGTYTASVLIVSDGQPNPFVLNLAGIATGAVPGLAVLGTNGASIASGEAADLAKGNAFGHSVVGSPLVRTFSLTNNGSSILSVSGWTTNGICNLRFAVSDLPASLGVGEMASFTVTYSPTEPGSCTAQLDIENDSPTPTYTLNLSGSAYQLSTNVGPYAGGNMITITNGHFGAITNILVGPAFLPVQPSASGANWFTIALPAAVGAGAVDIVVQTSDNGDTTLASAYTYHAQGVIGGGGGGSALPALITMTNTWLNGTNGFIMTGATASENSGRCASSAGDVNGDGFADLLVGAPDADPEGRSGAGVTYLLYGRSNGFPSLITLTNTWLDGTNGVILAGARASDFSGFAVSSAGDVNGDGFSDVLIGAKGADPAGRSGAGETYLVYGRSHGLPAFITLTNTWLDGTNGIILVGAAASDNSGTVVSSAGDVNGDGLADILIGANNADPEGRNAAGATYLVYGRSNGFPALITLTNTWLDGTNGAILAGAVASDNSGVAVSSAGDVNGDELADFLIGATAADPSGRSAAGETYLVYGRSNGFPALITLTNSWLDGTNGVILAGAVASDANGTSVSSAGDVNGDGFADVLISATGADPEGRSTAGETYLVYGRNHGLPALITLTNTWLDGINGVILAGAVAGDSSGKSVSSAGDLNGDGLADVLIGATGADPEGRSGAGEAYLVYGRESGLPAFITLTNSWLDGTNGIVMAGAKASDYCGKVVSSAGDVNGDGAVDFLVSAEGADPGGINAAGETYLIYGTASEPRPGVVPSSGSTTGGYPVTIVGTNLCDGSDVTLVTLCGVTATVVGVSGSTQIVATAGQAAAVGAGDVRVYSTSFGETVKSNAFTYLMPQFQLIGTNGAVIVNHNAASAADGTDFGASIVGQGSLTNTFTLTNSGNTALLIAGVSTSGAGSASFTVLDVPAVLSSSEAASFRIVFTPQGGPQNAAIAFMHNGTNTPFTLNVAGYGSGGGIRLSTNLLTFTATYAGSNPTTQTVILDNVGLSGFTYTNAIAYGSGASGWFASLPSAGAVALGGARTLTNTANIAGLNAGTYTATNRVTAPDATNSPQAYVVQLTVAQADQTISFPAISNKVAADHFVLDASADSGLPVSFAVAGGPASISTTTNGSELSFSGAGLVAIVASQSGNGNWNPAPSVTNTFTVTKAMASVTLANLTQIYNGTPRVVSVLTVPSDLSVFLTYNGSTNAPINSGSYSVTGTVIEAMYQGSEFGTLVVSKVGQSINFPAIVDQFWTNRLDLSATASSGLPVSFGVVSGPATLTGSTNLSFTGYGAVTILASQGGNINWHAATATNLFQVLGPGMALLGTNGMAIANGEAASSAKGSDFGGLIVGHAQTNFFSITNNGTAILHISGVTTSGPGAASFRLANIPSTVSVGTAVTFGVVFTPQSGSSLAAALNFANDGLMTPYVLNVGGLGLGGGIRLSTNWLSYAATYQGSSPTPQFVLMDNVGVSSFTYTNTIAYGVGASNWMTSLPNAGTVAQGEAVLLTNRVNIGGLNAGLYDATNWVAAPDATNSPQACTIRLTVDKANQTIVFPAISNQVATDQFLLDAFSGSGLPVSFAVAGGPASIAGTTNGYELSFSGAGVVAIAASQSGNSNWNPAVSVTNTFTVAKATASVTLTNLAQTYNGTPRVVSVLTVPAGLSVLLTYNGSTNAPINSGNYSVTGTVIETMYQGSQVGTLVVSKASQASLIFNPASPQAYQTTNALSAAGGSGTGIVSFAVLSGPGFLVNGTNLTMTSGIGAVRVCAAKAADALYNAVSVTGSVTAVKAGQTVGFPVIPAQVATNVLDLSATASSGLPITFSILSGPAVFMNTNMTRIAFTDAGVVVLRAGQGGDANWNAAAATNTFSVTKAIAMVVLTNLNQVYDGTAKQVVVSTMPTGLTVGVSYPSAGTGLPVNAGSYPVQADVLEDLYQGSATGILTIAQAGQTIAFDPIGNQAITNRLGLQATASSGLSVSFSVGSGPAVLANGTNLSFTATGAVSLVASQAGNANWNAASNVTRTFNVSPLKAIVSNPFHTNVQATVADMGATLENVHGANVTERGIVWSTTQGFDPAMASKSAQTGSFGVGVWTQQIVELTSGLTNFYRAYAVNAAGASYTVEAWVLMKPEAPVAEAATGIQPDSFQAHWQAAQGATNYLLDVSEDDEFGSFVAGYDNRGLGAVQLHTVTGLTAGLLYHYRLRAENATGASTNSSVICVLTSPRLTILTWPRDAGQTIPAQGSYVVEFGTPTQVVTWANTGYQFAYWEGAGGILVDDCYARTTTATVLMNSVLTAYYQQQAGLVDWTYTGWTFDPIHVTQVGTAQVCNNSTNGTRLMGPFWYCVQSNANHRLRYPTGTDAISGWPYLDVTAQIEAGAGDGVLDPGECVTVTNIIFYARYFKPPSNIVWQLRAVELPPADKADTDNDVMPDEWEEAYTGVLDPLNPMDGVEDADRDGMLNEAEWVSGTDPTDAHSIFAVETLGRPDGTANLLVWSSATGRVYRLFGATNVLADYILIRDGIQATPPVNVITDEVFGVDVQGYYRIDVQNR